MNKTHLRQQQTESANTQVLSSSMDQFVRLQEYQREFLAWLNEQEQGEHKGYEAVR